MTADTGHGEIGRARQCLTALTVLKDLDGPPTPDQHAALAGWSGWGPLAKVFEYHATGSTWRKIQTSVLELLTDQETVAAKLAVDTAFYTSPLVSGTIWGILAGLGFTGGRVLEPGCGAGAFITAAPDGLDVEWTGVEADPVTAQIAAALHPQARIIPGRLEKTPLRRGAFDAVVGNVPFSQSGPYDPAAPPRMSLHNYFIWRALCATRPGGIVTVITSRYTLDSNAAQRREIGDLADLIGAIRLPSTAFARLGTSVVADILVLRRRHPGGQPADREWLGEPRDTTVDGVKINPYFLANPSMITGTLTARGGQRYGHTLDVVLADGTDLADVLTDTASQIVKHACDAGLTWQPRDTGPAVLDDVLTPAEAGKDRSYILDGDGTAAQLVDGKRVKVRATAELAALIRLRDTALELFTAEATLDMPAAQRSMIRHRARAAYEAYVAGFGPLNRCTLSDGRPDEDGNPTIVRRRPAMGGFRADPDYPTVLALELWDDETGTASPAPILLRHVNQAPRRKTSTSDPGEALLLCLDQAGHVDLGIIASLLDAPADDVPGILAGQIWQDPSTLRWVTTDEYLSGNVRVKLTQACEAAEADPGQWAGNVAALEGVQPDDLTPEDISAQLGSPWIPPGDIEDFICELLGVHRNGSYEGSVTVRFEPFTSTWEVRGDTKLRSRPAARATWGTTRVNAVNLIKDALNGTTPAVYDTVGDGDGGERRVRNQAETALAADKIRDLQERFAAWVWEHPKRTDRLCRLYNDRFNSTRLRRYDGSLLTFPGLSGEFTPYASQRDMAWRIACTPAALCGYSVGAGKTATMILSAFLLRRLGLARKPCMIVPNHLLEQECAEARRLYPGGRILMVTKEDLTRDRRKTFAAKVAAHDWDLIVMTHQQFAAIPASPETQADYLATLIEELERATMNESLKESSMAKRLAGRKKKLIAQHEALLDAPRDDGLTWEQTGIDCLFVDEAHLFKNLAISSRAEGFSISGSKRADDLMMKLEWLRDRNPDGRCGYLFTGTPLSNSLAELFVMLRYLSPALLASRGLESFDAFAAQFIRYITATEVAPDGSGFRQYRRPAKYANLPELRAMLGEAADIRTRADLGLAGPDVTSEHVAVQATDQLAGYTASLVTRADRIRNGGVEPHQDNMLAVCTDGRRAALDVRLVGLDPDGPGKIEAVVANVTRIYQATASTLYPDPAGASLFGLRAGSLQIVFCDQGTPNPERGGQVYGRIRDGLIAAGVPAGRIAFIHDAKTGPDKAALFARCRDGQIAVLLGSTEKCGTGVNIQHRCAAIHHVDAPWRPADVEQREGRGNRPGNEHGRLHVVRYVTEGSFDAYMWQGLERKARFISQILTGDLAAREIEDAGNPAVLTFAEMKAIATGQPLLLELAEVNALISRLWNQSSGHKRSQSRMTGDFHSWHQTARGYEQRASGLRGIAELAASGDRELSTWHVVHTDGDAIAQALTGMITRAREERRPVHAGTWRGVEVTFEAEKRYTGKKPGMMLTIGFDTGLRSRGYRFTATGNVWRGGGHSVLTQMNEKLDAAAGLADEADERAVNAFRQADTLRPYLDQPFPREAELAAALQRRSEIEALIDAEVERPAAMSEAA